MPIHADALSAAAVETSLDDTAFDMQSSGSGAAAAPGSPPAVQRRTSSDSNQARLDSAIEQAESAPAAVGANFDRLVSRLCAAVEEEDDEDGDGGAAGAAAAAVAAGSSIVSVSRSSARRPQPPRKVTSGALRRFVSQRFGGGGATPQPSGAGNGAKGKGSVEEEADGDAEGDAVEEAKAKRPGEPEMVGGGGNCRLLAASISLVRPVHCNPSLPRAL